MNIAWGLIVIFTLLLLNAFFVAGGLATTSTRRPQIEALKTERAHGSVHAMYALEHISLTLVIRQLEVTITSTTLGLVTEPAIVKLVEKPLATLGTSASSVCLAAFLLALALVLFLHVVFAGVVPKDVSIANPARILLLLAPVLITVGHLLRPIIRAMDEFANRFVQLFGVEPKSEITAIFTTEGVASIVEVSATQEALSDDLGLLGDAFEFSEGSVQSAMVPLDELITLESTTTPIQAEHEIAVTGLSHFPITNEEGAITGYLHLKDVLYAKAEERNVPAAPWRIRKMGSVNAEDEVEGALRYIQKTETRYVFVVDDARRVLGVLSLEGVLEELVGEMRNGLQRDDLAWERSEERQALGGSVDRHSASPFCVEPGSSYETRGSVRGGEGFAVRAHFSRG